MKLIKILTSFLALIALQIAAAQWLDVPPPAEARILMVTGGVPVVAAASGACTSCTGTADADVLCEDFEGTENCNTGESRCRCSGWIVGDETGGAITVAAHSSGNTCADKGSYDLSIAKTGVGTTFLYGTLTQDNVYISFMFKLNSTNVGNSSWLRVGPSIVDSSTNSILRMTIYHSSGTDYYAGLNDETDYVAFTLSTWHDVRMHWIKGGSCTLTIDGTLIKTVSAANTAAAYLVLGRDYDDSINYNIEIDSLKVDDDTAPDPCS